MNGLYEEKTIYTYKRKQDVNKLVHYHCGGELVDTGTTVFVSISAVPLYECNKCGMDVDASEYQEFQNWHHYTHLHHKGFPS